MASEKPAKRARVDDCPPVYASLGDFAQGSEANRRRCERLVEAFRDKYGCRPLFLARAPGRVNIIGEHIDYSGYAVLPMAIEQDITIACRPNDTSMINLANMDSDNYPAFSCPASGFAIAGHSWHNYFLCGYKGVTEHVCVQNPTGVDLLVDGSVPPSAGLSSSSALVCCAALVALHANGVELPTKNALAELCARSERYIGTEGGGMDQAISFLGEIGRAKMIEFNPIRLTDVRLPAGTCFVISNTLVEENKAAPASRYNERVAECRLATKAIAKAKGVEEWRGVQKLLHLQDALGGGLEDLAGAVEETLQPEVYNRDDVCNCLGISDEELESLALSEKSKHMTAFHLHDRAKHVFQEAKRVVDFKDIANSGHEDDNITADKLGQLMDASHVSCRDLYQCSCTELDQLVALCRASGALGSRLTGAGWGGCAVSLVREDRVEEFMAAVATGYYEAMPSRRAALAQALFATKPGPGAALMECRD